MKLFLILGIIISLILPAFGDPPPSESPAANEAQALAVAVDGACYKFSNSVDVSFAEIYYSLFRNQLSFQPDTNGYFAMIDVLVEIKSSAGQLVDSLAWRSANEVSSLAESRIPGYLINDIITAQLKPGAYELTILVKDATSGRSGNKKFSLIVPEFSAENLNVSQLELVYSIAEPDSGRFDKAGRRIIPNTRGIYSHDDNIAYFFAEAYNLKPEWQSYSVDISIYDGNGDLYKELPPMTREIEDNSAVIMSGFNIAAFKVGAYRLLVSVRAGGQSVAAEKYFEITPGELEWQLALEKEELADFPEADRITSDAEAKNFRDQILFIATREELKQYDALPLQGKTNFARSFWSKRDPTPGTPINEFKIEQYRRIRFANEAFSTFSAPGSTQNGWRSDRGRVYIVYGPPSDEENHPSSLEEKPWIMWNFNDVEGGVYFVFIDESGYGSYRLIHSTARSEPKNYDWQERLRPSSTYR